VSDAGEPDDVGNDEPRPEGTRRHGGSFDGGYRPPPELPPPPDDATLDDFFRHYGPNREAMSRELKRRKHEKHLRLIVAGQLGVDPDAERPSGGESRHESRPREPDMPRPSETPRLPAGLQFFAHATIQRAVKLFASGTTRNDVAKRVPKLGSSHNATRVAKLSAGGLLSLNNQGKLVADGRVARRAGRIGLRYLDERSTGWLDPLTCAPPPTSKGGPG
jgi:hypothetical protein